MVFKKGNKINLGRKLTTEHKLKISIGGKGLKRSEETKKRISLARTGEKRPSPNKETRKKMSEAAKRNYQRGKKVSAFKMMWVENPNWRRGENHHNWKGGITLLTEGVRHCLEYRLWRSDIFTRDNFTCKTCGIRGTYLEAHHIKEFILIFEEYNIKTLQEAMECEELWNLNNGITLCKSCHNKTKKGQH